MENIKKAQWLFKISTIICLVILNFGLWKITNINKEYKNLDNMPISEYKIMSKESISENKDIKVFQYKVIVNSNIKPTNLETIMEDIVANAKNETNISGLSILMYSKTSELDGEYTIAKVNYAPRGNMQRALNEPGQGYDTFSYNVNPKANSLRQQEVKEEVKDEINPVKTTEKPIKTVVTQ